MEKKIRDNFADWVYWDEIEWLDFDEDVPDFSEKHWPHTEATPIVGENRILHVYKSFDERTGNEFLTLFEPALVYFNGWNEAIDEDIVKCAIVQCKMTNIIKRNEDEAWIEVEIKKVVYLNELYNYYEPIITDKDISIIEGVHEEYCQRRNVNKKWIITSWDAQGDCGETKWIYIDDDGIKHLVMENYFEFGNSLVCIGNIVQKR